MTVEVRGVVYPNLSEAARAEGITRTAMLKRVRSGNFPDHVSRHVPKGPGAAIGRWPAKSFEERCIARPLANELAHWAFDGDLARRVAVVDQDTGATVRRVGWLRCLRCARPTFSEDVVRVRLCWCCGGLGSDPVGPKLSTMLDIRQRQPSDSRSGRPNHARP